MESKRTVVYTDAGKERLNLLLIDLHRRVERILMEKKFVPGDRVIEITGSDVEEVARNLVFDVVRRHDYRSRMRELVMSLYAIGGALLIFAGLFLDELRQLLKEDSDRLFLISAGAVMLLLALFGRTYLKWRTDLVRFRQEVEQTDHHRDDA